MRERRGGHDRGVVVRALAVMLADGGDCLADLRAVREQEPLFGAVASDATAFRVVAAIAADPALLGALREARARARANAWNAGARPQRIVIDIDATLITAHSDKDGAAGTFRGGFGFHPLLAYLDETRQRRLREAFPMVVTGNPPLATVTGDKFEATSELAEPDHAGASVMPVLGVSWSAWQRWTPTRSVDVTVATCGSQFDTTLGVYTGSAVGGLTEVVSNDDDDLGLCDDPVNSAVAFSARAGVTYRIAVAGFGGAQGPYRMTLAEPEIVSLPRPGPPAADQPSAPAASARRRG